MSAATVLKPVQKTAAAETDLETLAEYYRKEAGLNVALRFVDNAEFAFNQLSRMPAIGAGLGFSVCAYAGFRRWHIEGLDRILILYRPTHEGVQIVRVVDGARDIAGLFDDLPR